MNDGPAAAGGGGQATGLIHRPALEGALRCTGPPRMTDRTRNAAPLGAPVENLPPRPPARSQGTYLMGEDVQAGRHRTAGQLLAFLHDLRRGSDGSPNGIPETTNEGPAFVTVQTSDGRVEFSGDCPWTLRGGSAT